MCSTCEAPRSEINKICRRCGSEPFIILEKIHVECRDCFLESCNKKLRSTIGRSKLLRNNDPILIAHSGSPSSTALLDLVKNSIESTFRREQKFRPSIIHVDTQSITQPSQDTSDRINTLEKFLQETKSNYPQWPLYWTTIETVARNVDNLEGPSFSIYEQGQPSVSSHLFDSQAANDLQLELLDLDLTDKQHHIRRSINRLMPQIAEEINHSLEDGHKFRCIFTATSGTQMANELLVGVILGEGSTCRSMVDVCDNRHAVPVVRPMRDFSKKEVAFYVRARNLKSTPRDNLLTLTDCKSSIQRLTESFLAGLADDYPATYSTLLRTGNKLEDSR